jgi:hypothetical protein
LGAVAGTIANRPCRRMRPPAAPFARSSLYELPHNSPLRLVIFRKHRQSAWTRAGARASRWDHDDDSGKVCPGRGTPWPACPDRDATLVRAGANGSGGDRLQVELLRTSERRKLGGAADLLRGLARRPQGLVTAGKIIAGTPGRDAAGACAAKTTQPPQPKLLVRPYPRSSWQYGPADAGTLATAAKAKARARTNFVIVVSYGFSCRSAAGRMPDRRFFGAGPHRVRGQGAPSTCWISSGRAGDGLEADVGLLWNLLGDFLEISHRDAGRSPQRIGRSVGSEAGLRRAWDAQAF